MPLRYPWDALHTQLKVLREFQNYRILSPFTAHAYLWTTFISFSYAFMFGKSIYLPSASLPQGAFLITTSCSGAKSRPTLKNQSRSQWICSALASWLKKTWSSWSFKGWWFYHNHPIPSFLTLSCMKWKHKRLDLHQAVVWPSDVLSHGDSGENPGMSIAFLFAEWSFATDCLNEFPEFIWDCMKSCMELGEWTHAH